MKDKRITIVSGHYGSGKTNIALNLAMALKKRHEKVAIADIDIVNPYFRTKDSEKMLSEQRIRLICSDYANTNLDIPALPQDIYAVTDDISTFFVLDVGGDERGALALGRIAPAIAQEADFEMLYVVNFFRPLTRRADSAMEVMREIEAACGLRFTAVVNNSNLGAETTKKDILQSVALAEELVVQAGIPLAYHTIPFFLADEFQEDREHFKPIRLQKHL